MKICFGQLEFLFYTMVVVVIIVTIAALVSLNKDITLAAMGAIVTISGYSIFKVEFQRINGS